jgi:type I restriction enzyme S subunit
MRISELIQQFCPNGVEKKQIKELIDYTQPGNYIVKSTQYDELYKIPVLTAGKSFVLGYTNEDVGVYVCSKEKPVIIFDDFTTSMHWVDFDFKVKSSALKILTPKTSEANFRFLYFVMKNLNYSIGNGTHSRHWISKYSKQEIPVPPLEVQNEIVRILDNFTELEAKLESELESELEARTKQYEYYRNRILNELDELYSKRNIGSVCFKTSTIKWADRKNENYRYIDLSSVDRVTHEISDTDIINADNAPSRAKRIIYTNDVIFATTRPTLKRFCIIPREYNNQICSTGFCVLRANDSEILPKFLYYQLANSRFNNYVESKQRGSAYPAISDSNVKKYEISVPPIDVQRITVDKLDSFTNYVLSVTRDIPAEIEARRKQYEYYRNKLLTF